MDRINETIRGEKIGKLKDQLKQLESRQLIEQKKIAQHQEALEEIESEMVTLKNDLAKLEKGMPLESGTALQYSAGIKRN
jgi:chromosome segregation ATPase